jgi:hypothetical protein
METAKNTILILWILKNQVHRKVKKLRKTDLSFGSRVAIKKPLISERLS